METFLSIIITVGGAVFVISQWRNGKNSAAKATIDLLEARATAFEKALQDEKEENKKNHLESQAASAKNHEEIIRLQEQLKHAKEENAKLMGILQGRDPALLDFMKLMTNYTLQGSEYMKTTSENLKAINTFMEQLVPKIDKL